MDSRLDIIRFRLADPLWVVQALGLDEKIIRQRLGVMILCPFHAERTPSCSVTTGPDGSLRFKCFGCGESGDVFHLVAVVNRLDVEHEFSLVVEKTMALAGVAPRELERNEPWIAETASYPPSREVEALWKASHPVNRTQINPDPRDLAVAFFFAARRWWPPTIAQLDIVRVAPLPNDFAWPSWWPPSWTSSWRLLTRGYTAKGEAVTLHARAVDDSEPKVRWPYGCSSSKVFLADALGAAVLRGEKQRLNAFVFVEGLSDIVTCAGDNFDLDRRFAFLGVTSSAMAGLAEVKAPAGVPQLIATHSDAAGDRFAASIKRYFPLAERIRLDGRS